MHTALPQIPVSTRLQGFQWSCSFWNGYRISCHHYKTHWGWEGNWHVWRKKALRIPLFAISTHKLSPVENFSKSIQNRFFCWSVSLNQKCNLGLSLNVPPSFAEFSFCHFLLPLPLAFGDISDARNKWIFQDVSSSSSSSKSRTASLPRTDMGILRADMMRHLFRKGLLEIIFITRSWRSAVARSR